MRKKVYISSADYMTRNTTRRVEVGVPVLDGEIKKRVLEYFDIQMHDNVKARVMNSDGIYVRAADSAVKCCAQEKFIAMAYENAPPLVTAPPPQPVQPVQTVQTAQPVQTVVQTVQQPVQPAPTVQPIQPVPEKKGLWARIKAFFSRKN